MRTETQESLDRLFTAKWNLPKAADNCGLSYDEMRIMFNAYCKTHPSLYNEDGSLKK
jgi:hypothetical protein